MSFFFLFGFLSCVVELIVGRVCVVVRCSKSWCFVCVLVLVMVVCACSTACSLVVVIVVSSVNVLLGVVML